jgi:hypothetical protein
VRQKKEMLSVVPQRKMESTNAPAMQALQQGQPQQIRCTNVQVRKMLPTPVQARKTKRINAPDRRMQITSVAAKKREPINAPGLRKGNINAQVTKHQKPRKPVKTIRRINARGKKREPEPLLSHIIALRGRSSSFLLLL